jgi:hypothetical protein
MKARQGLITERYEIEHRVEKNTMGKDKDYWYIRDLIYKKYGRIIARFTLEGPAKLSLEYLNHKKKIRRRKVRNG